MATNVAPTESTVPPSGSPGVGEGAPPPSDDISSLPFDDLLEADSFEEPSKAPPIEAPKAPPAESTKAAPTPTPAAAAAEKAQAPVAPPEPQATPIQQQSQQTAPQPPQAAPTQPAPTAQQPSEAELAAQAAAKRADFKRSLIELYKPAVDLQADKVISEPATVLADLAADLHMRVVESAVHGIMAQLPQVIGSYIQQTQATRAAEERFFSAWPQLASKRAEAQPIIKRIATAYRQSHPSASTEDFIREVGAMAMVALRLQPEAPPPVPPAPAAFKPVQPGSGGIPPSAPPKPASEWEVLQQEFLQDDSL